MKINNQEVYTLYNLEDGIFIINNKGESILFVETSKNKFTACFAVDPPEKVKEDEKVFILKTGNKENVTMYKEFEECTNNQLNREDGKFSFTELVQGWIKRLNV